MFFDFARSCSYFSVFVASDVHGTVVNKLNAHRFQAFDEANEFTLGDFFSMTILHIGVDGSLQSCGLPGWISNFYGAGISPRSFLEYYLSYF